MPTAIKIENLSKQYRLGVVNTGTLSHDLKRWWTTSIRRKEDPYLKIGETNVLSPNSSLAMHNSKLNSQYVWALKDINLDIEQGDVVGIIGKNGAGKSTLLKILSRVTKPTTGSIKYNGRIASLLEVGTGFHPEMTGRENIYMNGAIMGMTKAEITRKLDEIIDFSGVERYIDTPVKRYSSGMTVRLGFSIAAHLEPDILVVDEVLAVGDAEFQKKAIGKMQDVSKGGGRTVLFVSHNMGAVTDLCKNSVLLRDGMIEKIGETKKIVSCYLKQKNTVGTKQLWNINEAPGNETVKIIKTGLLNTDKKEVDFITTNESVGIYIEYQVLTNTKYFNLGINFFNEIGVHIFSSHDNNKYKAKSTITTGIYKKIIWIPDNLLQGGNYTVNLAAMRYNPFIVLFNIVDLMKIEIIDTYKSESRPEECNRTIPGIIRPKLNWEIIT